MAKLRKKAKRRIRVVLLLALLLIGIYGFKVFFSSEDNPIKDKITKIFAPANPIKVYKVKLIATGDGLIHSPLYRAAYKNGTYDFTGMLTYTKEKLKDYDIKYYNQETVFDDSNDSSLH